MITLDEFKNMEKGTIFYVAAGGRANNLVKEKFVEIEECETYRGLQYFIKVVRGVRNFESTYDCGRCCYMTLNEAKEAMWKRHIVKGELLEKKLHSQINELQRQLNEIKVNGYGEPDYVYLDCSKED